MVASIDGSAPIDPISLIGTPDGLYWPPGCAGQSIEWHTGADGYVFTRPDYEEPRTVCSIGYSPELPLVFDRLAEHRQFSRMSGGVLHFEGPGGSVTLIPARLASDGREIPASLVGEYRVGGIDGGEVPGGQSIAVSVDEKTISYGMRCAGFHWTYTLEGQEVVTRRPHNPADRAEGEPPPPVCAVAVSPGERALAIALDNASLIDVTASNGIVLSGENHSVTLFTQ